MVLLNGDLIPAGSGQAHLGVDGGVGDQFDITTLTPFGHIHMNSGVWHDPMTGQSGVLRYSQAAGAFQISIDGGKTFSSLVTNATVVTSVGVIGGADLTGNVDLASQSSGFIAITDNGGLSPLSFAVDNLGLSGLWRFPAQGFNGSVVNELTDFNGTKAQGSISVVGASGIVVDIIGNVVTVTPGPSGGFATSCVQAFASSTTWTVNHNLNTPHVLVQAYDNAVQANTIIPDRIRIISKDQVNLTFNIAQAGKVIIVACRDIF